MRHAALLLVCAAGLACSGSALAQGPIVIYSSVATSPTSDVPNGPGLKFNTFDRPVRSPDGQHWMFLARNTTGTATDAMILTGAGMAGLMRQQEGVTALEPGRVGENQSDRRVAINDSGDYIFATNLTGATTDDSVLVRGLGASLSISLREGQAIPGIAGATYGTGMGDPSLSNSGMAALRATSIVGVPAANNAAFLKGNGSMNVAQINIAALRPTGQIGTENWATLDVGAFWQDADGNHWLGRGGLTGAAATNQVLVRDNVVQIQEGTIIPGSGFLSKVSNIISGNMVSSGDWFARGENADDKAWVVRTGAVVAESGGLVGAGPERWTNGVWNIANGNTFFLHTGNNLGDYIVGGFTDATSEAALLFNGTDVILREGAPVDLNGNGLFDDDAFYDVSGLTGASLDNKVDGAFLTDDLWLYMTMDLKNGAGVEMGEAFVRMRVPAPGTGMVLGLAAVAGMRRRR